MNELAYTLPSNVLDPDPTRRHMTLLIEEVFPGIGEEQDPDTKYIVAIPNDKVSDIPNAKEYYVHAVDANYKPDLRLWNPNSTPESQSTSLVGFGVGAVNEAYRGYYNTTHVPNTFTIASYVHFKGNTVVGYRLFRGYDTTEETGEVISKHFDQNGNFMGDLVPVVAHFSEGEWKSVPNTANIQDSELRHEDPVTLVAYNAEGLQCHSALLITHLTNFTPNLNRTYREVSSISITSPYLDPNDSTVLKVPNNTNIWSIPIQGVVHYLDGTSDTFNFDQSEGKLHGLEGKVLSIPDIDYPIAASYYLSDNEIAFQSGNGAKRHVTIPLTLSLYQPDSSNVVKLFVVPEYISDTLGYRLNYWLHDLERNSPINVTSLVRYHDKFDFDPLAYNNRQSLVVSVDLTKVHPRYNDFEHTQDLEVLLVGEPSNNTDSWRLRYTEGAGWYGEDIEASIRTENNVSVFNIANGHTRSGEYLIDFYQRVAPLSDETAGVYAPTPTHVGIRHGSVVKRIPIEDFANDIIWTGVIPDGSTIEVLWLLESGGTYGYLGITPMTVKGM